MNAIQLMRHKAQAAGTLTSNAEQKVTKKGQTIIVEPADPEVVYMPAYDPWMVYGAPFAVWPGYYYLPPEGVVIGAGTIGFSVGIGIASIVTSTEPRSTEITPTAMLLVIAPGEMRALTMGLRVDSERPHGATGQHTGAFGGFNHGGHSRQFSSRGSRSFGATHADGFHGGAGFHGGGGHR